MLLQMVSKSNIERCASEDVGPLRGWIVRSHMSVRDENEPLHIRVWKPLLTRRKSLRESKKQYRLTDCWAITHLD